MRAALERMPVRWKLTAATTVLSVIALSVIAFATLVSFRAGLLANVRHDLLARGHRIARLVDRSGPAVLRTRPVAELLRPQGAVAQLLVPPATVVAVSPGGPRTPLTRQQQPSVSPVSIDHSDRSSLIETIGIRKGLVLTIARPAHDLDLADEGLRTALLIAVPVVLVLVIGGAYLVSSLALAPVERMRRRAASISVARDGARLPVSPANDELADLGRTLNELLDRVAESAEREHALIANASHELRTPLTRIQTRLDLALADKSEDTEIAQTLRDTERDVRRLSSLAADLLTLAALDERPKRTLEPVDILELVEDAAAARRPEAERLGRTLRVSGEPVVARGDSATLRQAVGNLIDNSLLHGMGAVTARVWQAEGSVRIEIADEGDGLDLPLEQATERFTRGAAGRDRPGAGLGLALVASVVRAHGGALLQQGSGLVIQLPSDGVSAHDGSERSI